jgi:hypothetical protein
MKASTLRKHYPALTADERFRLALAALARGDDDDLAVLRMTCPMKTYDATDEAFQGQWEGSARVVHHFRTCWLISLLRLREAEVALVRAQTALDYFSEGYTHGANAAWAEAGNDEAYLHAEDFKRYGRRPKAGEKPHEWEHAYLWQCCELKTVWAGFERFCTAVGFTPETLLGWWSAAGEYIERGRWALDSELPIDEAAADEMCRMHLWLWNQREMVTGKVEL